jgi:leader peptidase (prepilin peptidase)/N-methyltransferase
MLKLILVLLTSLFIIYNSFRIIEFINSKDDIKIIDKRLNRAIISILFSLFIGILYIKYGLSIIFIKYFLLMVYITVTGYIDHYSRSVYIFISIAFLAIGAGFIGVDLYYGASLITYLIVIPSILVICLNIAVLGFIGWGDVEVFIITALYIGSFISLINIFVAFSLAGIVAAYRLITRKVKAGDRGALCPYIAISTSILLIIL